MNELERKHSHHVPQSLPISQQLASQEVISTHSSPPFSSLFFLQNLMSFYVTMDPVSINLPEKWLEPEILS